jgi:FMN-dependent oxidoreductase (nitrilotriacetate monooxygenase family)
MVAMAKRRMHLMGYVVAGPTWHHNGSWRHARSDVPDLLNASRYEHIARVLERGKFDGLFFVDTLALVEFFDGSFDAVVRNGGQIFMLEPTQLLAAMARVTQHLGLAATMSTGFYPPFHIARSFATLDHISGGRAGWNIVTSMLTREAQNFGVDAIMDADQRYAKADEVVEASSALWESWASDAIVYDREKGVFADPSKVKHANYQGKWVKTRGPLPTPRSPQGRPVLMQAGSSGRGRDFAARWAEVVFTLQHAKTDMQAFYADVKGRMARVGRDPLDCAILPGIDVVVGETESIAQEKSEYMQDLVNAEFGTAEMGNATGANFAGMDLDTKVGELELKEGARGMLDVIMQGSRANDFTLREAGRRYGYTRMNPLLVGTAEMIADRLQDLFESGCCDGFMLCPSLTPSGYEEFCQMVVPELQRRGLFRSEYEGTTFRENLRAG